MPSMASPFSTEGAGAAWEYHVSKPPKRVCSDLHLLTLPLRSMDESSPTPWTWLPAEVSTTLSDWVPLRGIFVDVDLVDCLVGCRVVWLS
jgi:hypothetical protein